MSLPLPCAALLPEMNVSSSGGWAARSVLDAAGEAALGVRVVSELPRPTTSVTPTGAVSALAAGPASCTFRCTAPSGGGGGPEGAWSSRPSEGRWSSSTTGFSWRGGLERRLRRTINAPTATQTAAIAPQAMPTIAPVERPVLAPVEGPAAGIAFSWRRDRSATSLASD